MLIFFSSFWQAYSTSFIVILSFVTFFALFFWDPLYQHGNHRNFIYAKSAFSFLNPFSNFYILTILKECCLQSWPPAKLGAWESPGRACGQLLTSDDILVQRLYGTAISMWCVANSLYLFLSSKNPPGFYCCSWTTATLFYQKVFSLYNFFILPGKAGVSLR